MSDQKPASKTLSTSFQATTPKAFTRVGRNASAISALAGIERRAERTVKQALEHHKKFEDRWVARESIRIWEKQLHAQAKNAAPPGETPSANVEAIARIASRNVKARTSRRVAKINSIKTRMSNALVRSLEQPRVRQAFNEAAPAKRSPTRRMVP